MCVGVFVCVRASSWTWERREKKDGRKEHCAGRSVFFLGGAKNM